MNKFQTGLLGSLMLVGFCLQLTAAQPNVVVIYFDDTGWTDFGCFGGEVEMPFIDQPACEGMRFTSEPSDDTGHPSPSSQDQASRSILQRGAPARTS